MAIQLFSDKKDCSGCGACMNACPAGAIEMKADQYGFLYPSLDEGACIQCRRCLSACRYQHGERMASEGRTFAAASTDTDLLLSSSGGIFASLAKAVLDDSGLVYGCSMERDGEGFTVRHKGIGRLEDLKDLLGSKYVQSDTGYIYREIRDRLEEGLTVLFCGTPCQTDGLRGYLQKEYENLYTIDIVCHGVPSMQMLNDYFRLEEEREGKQLAAFSFRDKSLGWKLTGSRSFKGSEKVVFEPEESSYYYLFLNRYIYRENCYSCPYASKNRPGDITIGDFWCIELVHPELLKENGGSFDMQAGISCLVVNGKQGEELIRKYGRNLLKAESSYENAARYNRQLVSPSFCPEDRERILELYKRGYRYLDRWQKRHMIPIRIDRSLRAMVPSPVKRKLRAFLERKKDG